MQPYDRNVFINCPFDEEYSQIFDALIFVILDCGHVPRCALEIEDGIESRLKKILSIIKECRLGIHDVSRTQVDPIHTLPRFNMPFELGLFFGAKYYGTRLNAQKKCLVLDSEPYRYQKFISDLAGNDIKAHNNKYERVIEVVRNWLQTHIEKNIIFPGGRQIVKRYQLFQQQLSVMCEEMKLSDHQMAFVDYCNLVAIWLTNNPF